MKVEKQLVVKVKFNNGESLEVGDIVKFSTVNGCFMGEFKGIAAKRGSLQFTSTINKREYSWFVMPKSILDMELIERGVVNE